GAVAGGSKGTVCVRPERMRFIDDDGVSGNSAHGTFAHYENAVHGTFESYLHLGSSLRCIVRALGRSVIVTRPDHAGFVPPEPGARVRLAWGAADGQLLASE